MNTFYNFISKIKFTNGCWIWKTGCFQSGYGAFGVIENGRRKLVRAHRFSYLLFIGSIKQGLYVCHSCDHKKCVNPSHLFLGTALANAVDRNRKGRQARGDNTVYRLYPHLKMFGEKNPSAKLDSRTVRNIRLLYKTGLYTQRELGRKFNVTHRTIGLISSGKTWVNS